MLFLVAKNQIPMFPINNMATCFDDGWCDSEKSAVRSCPLIKPDDSADMMHFDYTFIV